MGPTAQCLSPRPFLEGCPPSMPGGPLGPLTTPVKPTLRSVSLGQSGACRMLTKECPWDQCLWMGGAGSRRGQREACNHDSGPRTASARPTGSSAVEWPFQVVLTWSRRPGFILPRQPATGHGPAWEGVWHGRAAL